MSSELKSIQDIVSTSEKHQLYHNLIIQLKKDFTYANIEIDLDDNTQPIQLKEILHEALYKLIQERFSDYLNLLYIIDISEEKIKQLDGSDIALLSEQVAFLVLKREWKKVWFKKNYS
ncbi:hypothetical protein C7447_101993 [Tenacibaculum adriaticum]|uniref:Uncharacterized protein n=1 Tax=Tenacibaculum adriaticum TaxID=413713 RepID=A0A5S5DWM4_9FLAO|nr:hypothetical protein [Tenacibaculum adriaticum]TYQ00381.1 hypothetical protein C7447_101993 [Tenacibaculum adriaticum]